MGRPSGPAPLSIEDKEARGNPGKRKLPSPAERPLNDRLFEMPPPPSYLGTYGTKEWLRTGPKLVKAKLLNETDLPAFEAYCLNIDLMIDARIDIKDNGMQVLGHRGYVRNPAIAAFGQASTAIRGFVSEFGLSPSARSRIRIPTEDTDILKELMGDDGPDDFTEEM
jgi:P27 family predicted phage terminase small subunit